MPWIGHLSLRHYLDPHGAQARTVGHARHQGPLRVLASLYPEGPGVCHQVIVHPPGGVVGGDELHVKVQVEAGAHALISTPAATRFYRSSGAHATQATELELLSGARLEWLPQETIVHAGARVDNRIHLRVAPGGQMLGWDILALGLPARGEAFDAHPGSDMTQRIEWPGIWLEHARLQTQDPLTHRVLASPLGWHGRTVQATAWLACGQGLRTDERERLVEATRRCLDTSTVAGSVDGDGGVQVACTSPESRLILVRVLGHRVEPVQHLLRAVRATWREHAWQMPAPPLRLWQT